MPRAKFLLLVLFAGLFLGVGGDRGTITGTVLDENGRILRGAKVHAAEVGAGPGPRILQFSETDSDGKFIISNLPWGTYTILAGKEQSGYADTKFAFYSNLSIPTVTLQPKFAQQNVIVKMPPKAGKVQVASLLDAETGKHIGSATITLRRVDHPNFFISTNTNQEQILVPSSTPVSIEIAKEGYENWTGPSGSGQLVVNLSPGQVYPLNASLKPVPPTQPPSESK